MAASSKDMLVIELKDTINTLNKTIGILNENLAKKDERINDLMMQIQNLAKSMYGSKSERRIDIFDGQLSLFEELEEPEIPVEVIEAEDITVKSHNRKKKPTLDEQFKHLPAEIVEVDSLSNEDKQCPICGTGMVRIGREYLRTEIQITRQVVKKIDYYAVSYECPECKDTEEPQFIKDTGTGALIPHSYISESLMTDIIYNKFCMYLPLNRQEADFARMNAPISRNAMAHGVIHVAENYFSPMFDFFHRELMKRKFIMMDETPTQVLKEKDRRAQSKSYLWIVRSGTDGLNPIILYNYTPTRAGENAKKFLKGMNPGYYLMTDAYQGYNKLSEAKRCCCYAHIRRYFMEAIPKGSEKDFTHLAVQGVLYCNKLFDYERRYKEKGLSYKQIHNRRLKDQKPIIEAFSSWASMADPGSNSKLKKALNYVINRKELLTTYLEDGRCSLSNNLTENSVRPITVGRKNWLFSDTPEGATANSKCLTMIEMAKAYALDPYKYIEFLLVNRPSYDMTDEEFEKLAPWNETVKDSCLNPQ